jgi:hypothetical protein
MADHDFPPESPEQPTGSCSTCEECAENMMRFRGKTGCVNLECKAFSMPEVIEYFEHEPEEIRALKESRGRTIH